MVDNKIIRDKRYSFKCNLKHDVCGIKQFKINSQSSLEKLQHYRTNLNKGMILHDTIVNSFYRTFMILRYFINRLLYKLIGKKINKINW